MFEKVKYFLCCVVFYFELMVGAVHCTMGLALLSMWIIGRFADVGFDKDELDWIKDRVIWHIWPWGGEV